jgi:hypothetical protein
VAYVQWKLDDNEIGEDEAQAALEKKPQTGDPPPMKIKGVPSFLRDLIAIKAMLAPEAPLEVSVRCWIIYEIRYGFADTSGKGFGSTILGKDSTRY